MEVTFEAGTARLFSKAFGSAKDAFSTITLELSKDRFRAYALHDMKNTIVHFQVDDANAIKTPEKAARAVDGVALLRSLAICAGLLSPPDASLILEFKPDRVHLDVRHGTRLLLRRTVLLSSAAPVSLSPLKGMPSKGTRVQFQNSHSLKESLNALRDISEEGEFELEFRKDHVKVISLPKKPENFFMCACDGEGEPVNARLLMIHLQLLAEPGSEASPDAFQMLVPADGPIVGKYSMPNVQLTYLVAKA